MNVLHVNKDFSGTGAQQVSLAILGSTSSEGRYYCADGTGPRNELFLERLRRNGVSMVPMRGLSNRWVLWLPVAVVQIARLIRRERIHLVHSHSFVAGIAARLAAFIAGVPCIHTFHGAPSRKYRTFAFYVCWLFETALARITRFVVFNSEHQKLQIGNESPSARVIHNYVPAGPSCAKPLSSPTAANVLFIGRLEFQKNPEFFVRLAARLKGRGLRFRMVGSGALESAVRGLNQRLEAAVEIIPFAEDPRVHFQWANCVVLCSRYESFPLVIGEALATGCAVASSRVDGLEDIWGDAVEFFEEGRLEDCARAVLRASRSVLGASASRAAVLERLDLRRFSAAYQDLYEEALNVGGATAGSGKLGME